MMQRGRLIGGSNDGEVVVIPASADLLTVNATGQRYVRTTSFEADPAAPAVKPNRWTRKVRTNPFPTPRT